MMSLERGDAEVAVRPTALQVESWRLLWQELCGDPESVAAYRAWESQRRSVRPHLLGLLRRFLAGAVPIEELRATIDERLRTEWTGFGLSGLSGVVFLNRLVRHVSEREELAAQLRRLLPAPADADSAEAQLRAFIGYLDALARSGVAGTALLQPGRSVFFASAWWHVQDAEAWPSYQPSARRVLREEQGGYVPAGEPIADYLAFREAFRRLAAALGLGAWELEYLCWWHARRARSEEGEWEAGPERLRRAGGGGTLDRRGSRASARLEARGGVARTASVSGTHTQVQWMLATLGRRLGCRVWIAANDHARVWNGESLGALSVSRFPSLGLRPSSERLVSLIDVVWLSGVNEVVAAFEVEHTSAIASGLLRMADLSVLSPNLRFPLYIVAPAARLGRVRRELARPTFQRLRLHERCAFFSSEALLEHAESIMRWATGPDAVARLAERAEAVSLDDA
jgi:hypothetical protein